MESELEFCIVSNNCWGGEVYAFNKIAYNTPFIGLFIPPLCFAKMCANLPKYLDQKLVFINRSKYSIYHDLRKSSTYPIALLGGIEIHFLHYISEEEASTKWIRRRKRMPNDQSLWMIKACDREISNWPLFAKLWNSIPYHKVFFSSKYRPYINNSIWFFEFFYKKELPDGKTQYNYSKDYFEVEKWLINKKGEISSIKKIKKAISFVINKLNSWKQA